MDGEDPYEFALMLGEPSLPVTGAGWDEIESALGVGLPEDYKAWGDRYRSLRFAEYLIIDNLRDDLELVSLDRIPVRVGDVALTRLLRHQRRRSAKLGASDGGVFRYRADEISVYPDDGGLLRIGLGDNNEMVYLLPPPSSTEGWRVVITDGAEWWLFDGPFERFLWELATGGLDCDALPDLSATPVTIEERETYHVYRDGSYHTNWRKLPL